MFFRKRKRASVFKPRIKRVGIFEQLEDRELLATLTVISSSDHGPGSLREAIENANFIPGPDVIQFALPTNDTIIRPLTELPAVTEPLTIDATTQPGYAGNPIVELSGERTIGFDYGLKLAGGNSLVSGLAIHSFPASGIFISGPGNNHITRNYVGLDSGITAKANRFIGIAIDNSPNNVIGGSTTDGNVISGNSAEGIRIVGSAAIGNKVQGNKIGTNPNGDQAVPNELEGIVIFNDAKGNIVGVDSDGLNDGQEGNLISGNNQNGIRIYSSQNNIVAGNVIGLAANLSASLANKQAGVLIDYNKSGEFGNSSGNLIGSNGDGQSDELERNWIGGNLLSGVRLDQSTQNQVSGNNIGGSAEGQGILGNGFDGILVSNNASNNLIGLKDGIGKGNVISGNGRNGVMIFGSTSNSIGGNYIGVTAIGDKPLPNSGRGIQIESGSNLNVVGTNDNGLFDSSERNVVSGNAMDGIAIAFQSSQNVITGNYIGTSANGLASVRNGLSGVLLSSQASNNTVGTKTSSPANSNAGNLISGNGQYGVQLEFQTTRNNVSGNWIGTDVSGNQAIPNVSGGVRLTSRSFDNVIGGLLSNQQNKISGNNGYGVLIEQGSFVNGIYGNAIGLAANQSALGNTLGGIRIDDAANNLIGAPLSGNTIAYNRKSAIVVTGSFSTGNRITTNSIFGNEGIPIDLGNDLTTPNDPLDLDSGPNTLINTPSVLYAASDGIQTIVMGTFGSDPLSTQEVESYVSADGANDAKELLGRSGPVKLNAQGQGVWLTSTDASTNLGLNVSAMATSNNGNSSEFSASKTVVELLPIELAAPTVTESASSVRATIRRGRIPLSQPITVQLNSSDTSSATVPNTVTIPRGELFAQFDITVLNNAIYNGDRTVILSGSDNQSVGAAALRIMEDDLFWHNPVNGNDVDNDGSVTPLDVLAIVNLLNSDFPRNLSLQTPFNPPRYIDTDYDSFLSPLDVLVVVNFLNSSGSGEGEGEGADTASDLSHEPMFSYAYWPEDTQELTSGNKRRAGFSVKR
jgi:hypothetical protein